MGGRASVPTDAWRKLLHMPTITLARSDLFPVGQSVGIYADGAQNMEGGAPNGAAIASATVDAAGLLTVTNAAILSLTRYVAAASVGGTWRYARCRSTLDVTDLGRATGTATLTSGSPAITSVVASTGAWAIGQRIVNAPGSVGIPPGTFLVAGSGGSWTMSAAATASGAGVGIEGHGATVPVAVLGATAVTSPISRWRARVMQRRSIAGTS